MEHHGTLLSCAVRSLIFFVLNVFQCCSSQDRSPARVVHPDGRDALEQSASRTVGQCMLSLVM